MCEADLKRSLDIMVAQRLSEKGEDGDGYLEQLGQQTAALASPAIVPPPQPQQPQTRQQQQQKQQQQQQPQTAPPSASDLVTCKATASSSSRDDETERDWEVLDDDDLEEIPGADDAY